MRAQHRPRDRRPSAARPTAEGSTAEWISRRCRYRVSVTPVNESAWHAACTAEVAAGGVADLDLTIDRQMPKTTIAASPSQLWPPNGRTVLVRVGGEATDLGTGLGRIVVRVIDEYGTVEPTVSPIDGGGAGMLPWQVNVPLVAARRRQERSDLNVAGDDHRSPV
jgi:hypothetical protein